MRLLHCSDLHIGRKINGYGTAEDQRHILGEIARIADERRVDAVLVAGDVYDSSSPSEEAVEIFDEFITRVSDRPVYIAAGNHDSVWRLSACRSILRKGSVYITGPYSGRAERYPVSDEHGELNIYMLPYTKVSTVRSWCRANGLDPDAVRTPDDAFSSTLERSRIDPEARNVLVAHEFVAGKGIELSRSGSEIRSLDPVGGADCISSRLLDPFDYVALGHIHSPQRAGRDAVLYCGSPLKYSASEIGDSKHAVIADIGPKGCVDIGFEPLVPMRDMVRLRGTVEEILAQADAHRGDYVVAEVTERAERIADRLSEVYRIVEIRRLYESGGGRAENARTLEEMRSEGPEALFERFFRDLTGREPSEYQRAMLRRAVEEAER